MLRVGVERDAGHLVECCFLCHVARVGDDAAGMGGEIAEVKVSHRINDLQVGELIVHERYAGFYGFAGGSS